MVNCLSGLADARVAIRRSRLLVLAVLVLQAGPVLAQVAPDALVDEIQVRFRSLDYERVEALSLEALATEGVFAPHQLVEIHRLLGLTYYYKGREDAAATQYRSALTLDRSLALDPVLVPPHARAFFDNVKEAFLAGSGEEAAVAELRYVVVHDRRPEAVLRSFVLPGWGQISKDDRTRGVILMGLWGATAGGGLAAHVARQAAQRRYEEPNPVEVIQARKETLDRWHKVRNSLALGAAVVWLYSAIDAAATGGPRRAVAAAAEAASPIRFSLEAGAAHPIVTLGVRF